MSKKTAFLHDELCLWHTTGEHVLLMPVGGWVQPSASAGLAESPESKRRIKALMDISGLTAKLDYHSANPVAEEDILRVHKATYIEKFKAISDAGGGALDSTAPFGRGSYEIACLSAGLAKRAVEDVLEGCNQNAYSLSRPPGHHCLADQSMGFCLLANIPIAIEAAKANYAVEKVAVVDWDVHHGNGTQTIFYNRNDVLTISLHQEDNFPPGSGLLSERGEGKGNGYNFNINLLPGSGHEIYLYALRRIVLPILRSYEPDLIIIASGLDANQFDPLSRMQLTSVSFREMTQLMMEVADELCNGRLVMVHEGGYSEAYVPFCGLAIIEALSNERTGVEDMFGETSGNERFNAFHRMILDEMAEAFKL